MVSARTLSIRFIAGFRPGKDQRILLVAPRILLSAGNVVVCGRLNSLHLLAARSHCHVTVASNWRLCVLAIITASSFDVLAVHQFSGWDISPRGRISCFLNAPHVNNLSPSNDFVLCSSRRSRNARLFDLRGTRLLVAASAHQSLPPSDLSCADALLLEHPVERFEI